MGYSRLRRSRALAIAAAAALVTTSLSVVFASAATADTKPTSSSTPTTVSADSLATAQLSGGVGYGQAVIGNTVYVGGSFTGALAPGATSGASTRHNLMSYNLTTGALNSFAPNVNGLIKSIAASPDGTVLYIGGAFTTVGGVAANHIAALNPTTGALITSFAATANAQVNVVKASASTVFFGGAFTTVDGATRTRAAAVSASTGAVTSFAPSIADNSVSSMALNSDASKVAIGGMFTSINGVTGGAFAIVDAATGKTFTNTPIRTVITDGSTSSSIDGMSTDGTNVYASGYYSQQDPAMTGNSEGTFAVNWASGATVWLEDCHGDEYSNAVLNGALYVVGHPHYCDDVTGGYPQTPNMPTSPTYQRTVAFTTAATGTLNSNTILQPRYYNFAGTPSPSMLDWFPTLTAGTYTGAYQAAYNVITSGNYVLETGEFPKVNGGTQYGTARFALPSVASNKVGPQLSGTSFPVTVKSFKAGSVRLAWLANYDLDNENLTYTLYRGTTAIYTTTAASRIWYQRPTLSYTDTGLTAGTSYSYHVVATDPYGNTATGGSTSITVPSSSASAYDQQVVADGATSLWRLDESSGTAIADSAGGLPATTYGGVTLGTAGAIGDGDTAATFDGSASNGTTIATNAYQNATDTLSVESWFKTTSTTGGEIIGQGDAKTLTTTTFTPPGGTAMTQTADSSNHDREIATTADGHVTFTIDPLSNVEAITSAKSGYNDGKWHMVVGTMSSAGTKLYIDGALAASNSSYTRALGMTMYWRIGGDSGYSTAAAGQMGPPPSSPDYFAGSIDEPAAYVGTALTATQVANQYALVSGGAVTPTNTPPTASFTQSTSGLGVSVDGSGSTDSDGTIASYSWNFGDGGTATGATATHTYSQAGTYTVTLTVTDNDGATGTSSQTIAVTSGGTNAAPTASFTDTVNGLAVSTDGSGSTDSDGTIASYAWNFGDGDTATGATASHTYASAGTYSVTLTVTDNGGATGTSTQSVSVAAAGGTVTPFASDSFGRTTTGGLGTATTGGAWTVTGTKSQYSTNGSTANLSAAKGVTLKALLGSTSSTDTDLALAASISKLPVGGSAFIGVIGRSVGTDLYQARVIVAASGSATLELDHGTTALKSVKLTGLTVAAGTVLDIDLQVYGTSPTTIRANVWKDGTTEPTTWQASTTDSTSALQVAGSVGIGAYSGSGLTNGPIVYSFDNLVAEATGN